MIERLRVVFQRTTQRGTLYECRDCGRNLDRADTRCPHCDSDEIASYTL